MSIPKLIPGLKNLIFNKVKPDYALGSTRPLKAKVEFIEVNGAYHAANDQAREALTQVGLNDFAFLNLTLLKKQLKTKDYQFELKAKPKTRPLKGGYP